MVYLTPVVPSSPSTDISTGPSPGAKEAYGDFNTQSGHLDTEHEQYVSKNTTKTIRMGSCLSYVIFGNVRGLYSHSDKTKPSILMD